MASGFRGKYFSLQAITATVGAITLRRTHTRVQDCHRFERPRSGDALDDPPPDDLEILLGVIEPFSPKVSRCQCHCNRYFGRRTRCALIVASFVPKLRFLYRYFHTDTSPPRPFSLHS
ncbi:MAG: hypothetical protein JXK05_12925 [Campylobacterales bacterium]|nr:hypothetical protein [Campylobacterales bacterium]